ncbi:hypothetical protein V8C34DRAFT_212682 [Trichoderma compactum]
MSESEGGKQATRIRVLVWSFRTESPANAHHQATTSFDPRKRGKKQNGPFTGLAGVGNDGDLPDAGFGTPLPLFFFLLPICHPFLQTHTRAEPRTHAEGETETWLDSGPIRVAASLECCVSSNPSRTRWGGWQRQDTHEHASATACMESSWPRTKYDPIHGEGWSAGLQSWGVSQPVTVTTKAQSRARPNRHHGQRQRESQPGLFSFIAPLTPTFPDGGLRHNLTGTPFPRWPCSSIVFYLVVFESSHMRVHTGMQFNDRCK